MRLLPAIPASDPAPPFHIHALVQAAILTGETHEHVQDLLLLDVTPLRQAAPLACVAIMPRPVAPSPQAAATDAAAAATSRPLAPLPSTRVPCAASLRLRPAARPAAWAWRRRAAS